MASAALLLLRGRQPRLRRKPASPVPLPRARVRSAAGPKAVPAAAPTATSAAVSTKTIAPAATPAPAKSTVPLAVAPTTTTGSADLAAVRKAIDLVQHDKMTEADRCRPHGHAIRSRAS